MSLTYRITHKSQGFECPTVLIPLTTQHDMPLMRSLVWTDVTSGKRYRIHRLTESCAFSPDADTGRA